MIENIYNMLTSNDNKTNKLATTILLKNRQLLYELIKQNTKTEEDYISYKNIISTGFIHKICIRCDYLFFIFTKSCQNFCIRILITQKTLY